jgi:fructose-specific component phosphotransferase system IIB-like protein
LAVKKIADNAAAELDYIIIFGSSITPWCHFNSDIDVCLIGENAAAFNPDPLRTEGQAYDFLPYSSVAEIKKRSRTDRCNVESRILKDGLIIYEGRRNPAGPGED